MIFTSTLLGNDHASTPFGSVTLVSVDNAVGGSATLSNPPLNNQIQFSADPTFAGLASFTYTITDDQTGDQSTATVRFVIQPTHPVIAAGLGYDTTWIDLSADGHLDVVYGSTMFAGDGTGDFGPQQSLVTPALTSAVYADFNHDGHLDILGILPYGAGLALDYFDPTTGTYVDSGATFDLPGLTQVEFVSEADFDNDGNPDLVVSGLVSVAGQLVNTTVFLRNDGAGSFVYQQGEGLQLVSCSWADANGDGFLDLLANNPNSGPEYFQNDGTGQFATPVNPSLNTNGYVSTWGDYDSDGFPDFVAAGINPNAGAELGLYHNNGDGTFTYSGSLGLWNQTDPHLQWADVNSDGRPDHIDTQNGTTNIAVNDGGLLVQATPTDVPVLTQLAYNPTPIAWGDYNNDGTLDLLQGGSVIKNYGAAPTSAPTAPTNLIATVGNGGAMRLSWSPGSDDNTPWAALTYTIRVGTTPGGGDVVSAPALADGTRLVAAPGEFSQPFATVTGLKAHTTYYWSVQAVDATYRGSEFSASGSFSFDNPPQVLPGGRATTIEDTPLQLQASDFTAAVRDPDAGDTVQFIRIDTLPTLGLLLYQGSAVQVGQEFPVSGPGYDPTNWLVYVPDANTSALYFPLDQIGYAPSDGIQYGNTGNLQIFVIPRTDTPYLNVSDFAVPNSVPTLFPVDAGTPDADGSETVTINIVGMPANATLSAGSLQGGVWTLSAADLVGLQITVDSPTATSFDLDIQVQSHEIGGGFDQLVTNRITVSVVVPTIDSITVPSSGVEGTPINLWASATDPSATGLTYTWEILSPSGSFQLFGSNGSFTPPDDGPYEVILTVTDGNAASTQSASIHIDVANVAPTINSVTNSGPVLEGKPVTVVVDATDVANANDPLTYTYDYDNDGTYESNSPTHTFATAGLYAVGVRVDDGDGGVVFDSTTVTVTHAAPTQPADSDSTLDTVVEGDANGTAVGITASSAQAQGLPITYSLTNPAGGRFAIDQTTGVVTVADGTLLDYETQSSYTITVQASDGQGGIATQDFTIAVTNATPSTPTDSDNTANSVVEGAANGTPVGITAVSSDVNGPAVTFSLTDDAGGRFAIDAVTGVVMVADGTLLDYETATSHTMTVQASDGRGGISSQDFTINVANANPTTPTDVNPAANAVLETSVNGTPVGITARSNDPNGPTLVYNLIDNAGGRFAIDPTTGIVTVANSGLLDSQVAPSHTILVQVSDGRGGTSTHAFTISVIDTHGPTVAISAPSSSVTITGPITYTITYADINFRTSTLSAADITLNRTGTANGIVSVSPGSGTTRTVTITGITGDGTLGISLAAGTASDTAENLALGAGPSATVSVDRDMPGVVISAPSQSFARTGDTVAYTITYTDTTLQNVTLTAANVTLLRTGSAKGTVLVSGSGNTRTVTITKITGDGTLGISIKAGTATDASGQKAPAAGPSDKFVVDNTAPKVTIGSPIVTARNFIFTTAVEYIITITEANLASVNLTENSITLNSAKGVTARIVVTQIDETHFRVSLSNFSAQDSIWISVGAEVAQDTLGVLSAGPINSAKILIYSFS